VDFAGGQLSSDGGSPLLAKTDQWMGLTERFAALFTDHRDPDATEHPVLDLVRQRVYGLALGYEDLNDHDELSRDPLLAAAVGKKDPTGESRVRERDRGRPMAGKSTLNRLELAVPPAERQDRYKKVVLDTERAERFFAEVFVAFPRREPETLVLDFDGTHDILYGKQEGRHFNAYYDEYGYLPLYVFCGDELLVAQLRPGCVDGPEGTVEILQWLVPMLRSRFPKVRLIVRADSAFARDEILAWCERHRVDYVIGLSKNSRLTAALAEEQAAAKAEWETTHETARVFRDFRYSTRESWSRERRVVGKAEHGDQGANPRFVVSSLPRRGRRGWEGQALYEDLYCARGEMENRIKEQQLYLFADRTSTSKLRANQIRLWFSSVAYTLLNAFRTLGLKGTELARARCDTIRLKLLKIGASVRVTVRRVWVSLASSFPLQGLFVAVWRRLETLRKRPVYEPMRC